jgi:hypothetical protein
MFDSGPLDAVEAAGDRLDHGGNVRWERRRDGEEVARRDPLRHEQILGVGAVQHREEALAERLVAASARSTRAARGGVRSEDAATGRDVDAAELVPEGARKLAEEDGMPPPEGLGVGSVGERDLDLDEDIARSGLGSW